MVTNQKVIKLKDDKGVETTILCDTAKVYTHEMVDSIIAIPITSNTILFDELEKLL